jgi:putative membrane protein
MPYRKFASEDLVLRDELALDRTRLANERTLLAYARTSIMLLVSGATALKLAADRLSPMNLGAKQVGAEWDVDRVTLWAFATGGVCVGLLGLWVGVYGAVRYLRMRRELSRLVGRDQAGAENR